MKKKVERKTALKYVLVPFFIVYIAALLGILLFRNKTFAESAGSVNLIPLHTIRQYFHLLFYGGSAGFWEFFSNVFGNIIILVPLGYFLPVFFRNLRARHVVLITMLFSIGVECLQYRLQVGTSDVDDVILNTIGGFVGYITFRFFARRRTLSRPAYVMLIFLSIVMLSGGALYGVREYGVITGTGTILDPTTQAVIASHTKSALHVLPWQINRQTVLDFLHKIGRGVSNLLHP